MQNICLSSISILFAPAPVPAPHPAVPPIESLKLLPRGWFGYGERREGKIDIIYTRNTPYPTGSIAFTINGAVYEVKARKLVLTTKYMDYIGDWLSVKLKRRETTEGGHHHPDIQCFYYSVQRQKDPKTIKSATHCWFLNQEELGTDTFERWGDVEDPDMNKVRKTVSVTFSVRYIPK